VNPSKKVHAFDNGVKVYDDQLLDYQRERYRKVNVHEEDEERLFLQIIESLKENASFVNVGTAIGYYPILARMKRKDIAIHCFEPLPGHLRQFEENIQLNQLGSHDFSVYNLAVSDHAGESHFEENSYASSIIEEHIQLTPKALFRKLREKLGLRKVAQSTIRVPSIRLSDVFSTIGCDRIDFLQMDIQGHELAVWKAYFSAEPAHPDGIASILLGTHGKEIHEGCRRLFKKHGYTIAHDEQETLNQPDGILYCTRDGA
jgi:FkbM family methyltransferase